MWHIAIEALQLSHGDFLLHSLEVHGVLDHVIVVPDFLFVYWLAERPRVFVLKQYIKHLIALLFKAALIGLLLLQIGLFIPTSLHQTWNFLKLVLFFSRKVQAWMLLEANEL